MMGQSARDPLFYAGLAIANNDAAGAGEFCIRCHVPNAFLAGRATPPDGSAFIPQDLEGINCTFCHRIVDPEFKPGISPHQDQSILAALEQADYLPFEPGNAQYVIDPVDNRRGPRDDIMVNLHPGNPVPELIVSPFHATSEFCWSCHDVSNPLMVRDRGEGEFPEDSYILGALDASHVTGHQLDMFPLHRTYSEWKNSYYSTVGIQHDGRFGGNHPTGVMKTCQDCHMPMTQGFGCSFQSIFRDDLRHHTFVGANTWVLRAVRDLYPDGQTGLNATMVDEAIARNLDFLSKASDMQLTRNGDNLRVRIINRTGHKLPTGFPDGRRMWINVQFYDNDDRIVHEHGVYDFDTATLETATTKVYEMILGIDAEQAALVGHPEGKTLHFMLANDILKDNRIPPAGWFRSTARELQTLPVGADYASGQHWDDTHFQIPNGACRAVVTVYYQTTSREFIEFLRDAGPKGDAHGQIAYDQWMLHGKSQPAVMDMAEFNFFHWADLNQDGSVDVSDLLLLLAAWGSCPRPCSADLNGDGVVDVSDLLILLANWGISCG